MSLVKQIDRAQLQKTVYAILKGTLMFMNEEMTDEYKKFYVQQIMNDKKVNWEGLEDIAYVMHKICREKKYGKFSLNHFFTEFDQHLEQKAIAREKEHQALKGGDPFDRTNSKSQLKQLLKR